jgi:excisionase family DNA binding protein
MFADYPDVVGVAELQTMLGVGRKLAYRLIGEGEIQALHVGRTYRIPKVNVIAYLTNGHENKVPAAWHLLLQSQILHANIQVSSGRLIFL